MLLASELFVIEPAAPGEQAHCQQLLDLGNRQERLQSLVGHARQFAGQLPQGAVAGVGAQHGLVGVEADRFAPVVSLPRQQGFFAEAGGGQFQRIVEAFDGESAGEAEGFLRGFGVGAQAPGDFLVAERFGGRGEGAAVGC